MEIRNFKPFIITISSAVAAIFFTKKRIKRTRLKGVHSKMNEHDLSAKKN